MTSPETFFDAMLEKFNEKIREGRSSQPWMDHDEGFLWSRLGDEWEELGDVAKKTIQERDLNQIQAELIDVSLLCCFIWLQLECGKNE